MVLFDLWLNESRNIIKEVIEESNLKQIMQNKLKEFMKTETFQEYIDTLLKQEIKNQIEEYAEFLLCTDEEYDNLYRQIYDIITKDRIQDSKPQQIQFLNNKILNDDNLYNNLWD